MQSPSSHSHLFNSKKQWKQIGPKKNQSIYIYVYWVQTVSHLMIVLLKDERYIWGNAGNQKEHNSAAFFS